MQLSDMFRKSKPLKISLKNAGQRFIYNSTFKAKLISGTWVENILPAILYVCSMKCQFAGKSNWN